MHIWVDADACPKIIKEILVRAAIRTETEITFIANQLLQLPPSPLIHRMHVQPGFDVADNKIVELLSAGDLVITADIPLADLVIAKKGIALNPRGELYSVNNIKARLSMRNISDQLRSSGIQTGGPMSLSKKDIQKFSSHLDKILSA